MANYYTHFSVIVDLPDVAAQQYALNLIDKIRALTSPDEVPGEIPKELHPNLDEWHFDTEPCGNKLQPSIWLHTENGGVDAACSFIQHLLSKFNPQGQVSLQWSHDCSKPHADAFGGGAAFITANEVQSINTSDWVNNLINQHSKTNHV